jgi:hypothetical protein
MNASDILSVAHVAQRDTEHQTPSQMAAWSVGKWPTPDTITNIVDAGEIKTTTGYYGGTIPDHSAHWYDFFAGDIQLSPTGKPQQFINTPDPTGVADAVSESQHLASANGPDTWSWFRSNFRGALDKIAPNNSYKPWNP